MADLDQSRIQAEDYNGLLDNFACRICLSSTLDEGLIDAFRWTRQVPENSTPIIVSPSKLFLAISKGQRGKNAPLKGQQQHPAVFATWFSRCHRLLYFIACRVLGAPERAEDAIENCWLTASRNPPQFEYEGAFRAWVLRILIDEALAIRGQGQEIKEPIARQQDAGSKNS